MKLDEDVNYIVSGLERSGTSMLMQILHAGNVPVAFDRSRPSDEDNPRGYYELEGGKIINRLKEGSFPLEKYKGCFIKITAYGMKFLPQGDYKVVYSERDMEEILDSMERMAVEKDDERSSTRKAFVKLNRMVKQSLKERDDVEVLFVNYNHIIENPEERIKRIQNFLDVPSDNFDDMLSVVDKRLYRQRRK